MPSTVSTSCHVRVVLPSAAISGRSDTSTTSPGAATTTRAPVRGSTAASGQSDTMALGPLRSLIASGPASAGPVNQAATNWADPGSRPGSPEASGGTSAYRPTTRTHLFPDTSPAKTTERVSTGGSGR